tara:strand:- start:32 stop:448 length:417 start_codon:yes stop_codon:yes gene_type:complete
MFAMASNVWGEIKPHLKYMSLARVYVLLALVVASVAAHSLYNSYATQVVEGYTASEGRELADKKLSQQNSSDLRTLQAQVENLEHVRQEINDLTTETDGHADRIKRISKQAQQIGPGKQVAQVKVSGSQSSAVESKYK